MPSNKRGSSSQGYRTPTRAAMGHGVYWESMMSWERGLLEWALEIGQGNYDKTARVLGTSKGHVYNRCRTLGIDVSLYQPKRGPKEEVLAETPEAQSQEVETEETEETEEEIVEDEGEASDENEEEFEDEGENDNDETIPEEDPEEEDSDDDA